MRPDAKVVTAEMDSVMGRNGEMNFARFVEMGFGRRLGGGDDEGRGRYASSGPLLSRLLPASSSRATRSRSIAIADIPDMSI